MSNRKQRRANQSYNVTGEPAAVEINNLIALFNQGRLFEAEAFARAITVRFPKFGFGWKVLGAVLKSLGRLEDSLVPMRRGIELLPEDAQACTNLGVTLKELGRLDEAKECYLAALKINPHYAEAYSTLGNILNERGSQHEAEICYRNALRIKPDYADALSNLGTILNETGRLEEAKVCYLNALEIKPDYDKAHYNLGNVFKNMDLVNEAYACFCRALEINPLFAEAHNNLGNVYKELDRTEEAEACFRRALDIEPQLSVAHSNILLNLNYGSRSTPEFLLEEARKFGQMVSNKVRHSFSEWNCNHEFERIKVGLVSGDLHNHPVGFFLEGLSEQLDPSRVELIVYTTDFREDELTARIKPRFSEWKSLIGKSDEVAARFIHKDGIHVLIDLSGHTANNRLPVFAWKPAPVQATWLGYLATTGVEEIDYLIGDPHATPPEIDHLFSEKVWRMPDVWGCFTPPAVSLEVGQLPALSANGITFGCFNNLNKMNDEVVRMWSRVLHEVPRSRLFLKTKQLGNPDVRDITIQRFAAHGITAERLLLEGSSPRAALLAAYNRVDIVLDPFPYTGGTTNFEALWMAVPAITRRGDSFISRGGQSIVLNAGLSDWIADDDDDYVAKAVLHASDLERLAALRAGLRQQVLASPLYDAARFARNFEEAVCGMWDKWCLDRKAS